MKSVIRMALVLLLVIGSWSGVFTDNARAGMNDYIAQAYQRTEAGTNPKENSNKKEETNASNVSNVNVRAGMNNYIAQAYQRTNADTNAKENSNKKK
ncbi:MAG: hypothetical protein F6K54_03485 [Okeania sp. SIO3B5]|uniref:hypothetical protein n=1 Tax=Okeania sp. SIO3B5 TaxID=2607811 RepID=UPI0014016E77|nr:hypothetical protein [Okeania sp. SIO3B5]NEO52225.1 hypothetical protein [Okeania sp. SIO3B5]